MPNKSLGQHWLYDDTSLNAVADGAEVGQGDTVVEIGPGLGTLTQVLLEREAEVIAVEFDQELADQLLGNVIGDKLNVVHQDILQFDFSALPAGYKIVGNIPYYLTSRLVRNLLELPNQPQAISLLVQKEVAERLSAAPGSMSILSVAAQLYADCQLGPLVPRSLFSPPPKVDSQVVVLRPKVRNLPVDTKLFFRVVKAGFGERRKKLSNSLSGGLGISKQKVEAYLQSTGLDSSVRAQNLSIDQWLGLAEWVADLKK